MLDFWNSVIKGTRVRRRSFPLAILLPTRFCAGRRRARKARSCLDRRSRSWSCTPTGSREGRGRRRATHRQRGDVQVARLWYVSPPITRLLNLNVCVVDAANSIQPPPYPNLPKGIPGAGYKDGVVHFVSYDVSKAARILGLGSERKYITKEECTRDSIQDFVSRGWEP
jgi:hypothetical protein